MDEIRFFHRQAEDMREAARAAVTDVECRQLLQLANHYDREARRLNLQEVKAQAS